MNYIEAGRESFEKLESWQRSRGRHFLRKRIMIVRARTLRGRVAGSLPQRYLISQPHLSFSHLSSNSRHIINFTIRITITIITCSIAICYLAHSLLQSIIHSLAPHSCHLVDILAHNYRSVISCDHHSPVPYLSCFIVRLT